MFLDLVRETTGNEVESGSEVRFNCPFCGDERQKLYIQADEPFLWHCKYCDRHGNPVQFVKEFYGIPFVEAKELLESYDYYIDDEVRSKLNSYSDTELTEAEQLLMLLSKANSTEAKEEVIDELNPVDMPKGFKLLKDNVDNPESYPYFNYLQKRNISPYLALYYNIGYIDDGSYYNPNKDTESFIRHSIVFTTKDKTGNVIYWSTRAIEKDAYVKSLNAPVLDGYYSKRNTIFNLYSAENTGSIVVSEGILNAITTGPSGVATFGKQVTDDQVLLLKQAYHRNPSLKFYIFLDTDANEQTLTLAKRIYEFTDNIYLVPNPYKGKDANDLGFEITKKLLDNAVQYSPNSLSELLLLTN